MKRFFNRFGALLVTGIILAQPVAACTGVYVGRDLTEDGSVIFGRTEDLERSHNKTFIIVEEKENEKGEKLVDEYTKFEYILPKNSYKYFAVPDTTPEWGLYYEAGYNEHGVAMDATTTTYTNDAVLEVDPLVENGLSESIMTTIVLGQVKTAREGIELLAEIVDEKGSSEGNGFIIADQTETWYMEILSGHQYAAIKMPDDKYAVFPNSFFIEDIDIYDNENVIASADLINTAEEAGTLVEENGSIRVADSYAAEIDSGSISRYWSGVKVLDPDADVSMDDTEFPFLRATDKKIALEDIMKLQRNRFENTEYIPADNIASSTGGELEETEVKENADKSKSELPKNAKYPIGNKNTMEAHIFQIYEDMPEKIPGVMWLAIGSPTVSPYLPYYGNIKDTIPAYQVETNEYDPASFYWTADNILEAMLSDESNSKETIQEEVMAIEQEGISNFEEMRQDLIAKYDEDPDAAAKWITKQTMSLSQSAFDQLKKIEEKYSLE